MVIARAVTVAVRPGDDGAQDLDAEGRQPIVRVLNLGNATHVLQNREHGRVEWAVFTAFPLLDDGELSGAVVTFLRITERYEKPLREIFE